MSEQALMASKQAKNPIDPRFLPQYVDYATEHKAGTIIVDTQVRSFYISLPVKEKPVVTAWVWAKLVFEWSGTEKITRKKSGQAGVHRNL